MKRIKKFLCFAVSLAVIAAACSSFSVSAARSITGLEIITLPDKTEFIEETDWVYGLWEESDTGGGIIAVPAELISFTHNPCCGRYPERGMLDMTGLSIRVSYSDGTSKVMNYAETVNKNGQLTQNILASPKGGKYSVGTNIIEVYLAENTKFYDSYTIEIIESDLEEPIVKLSSEKAVINNNSGYITGLDTYLTKPVLESDWFDFGSAEVTFSKANKSAKYYGTGSTLTASYPDGTTETFTFVITGDLDGNGTIDFRDVNIMSGAINGAPLTAEQEKAAEADGMRRITANDLLAIAEIAAKG